MYACTITLKDDDGEGPARSFVRSLFSYFLPLIVFLFMSPPFLVTKNQGEYTLEISDIAGNGLSPVASGSDKKGSWRLTALYQEDNQTELASGGANFFSKDLVDFVVDAVETQSPELVTEEKNSEPSNDCLEKKLAEERSLGLSTGIVCDCAQDAFSMSSGRWELSCVDTNTNNICAINHGACGDPISVKCCGNRRCSNGRCRLVSQGRDDRRIPLLAGEGNRTEGTIRGSRGGNDDIP